ncbi:PRP40 pre-mRNA processing factor 40 [Actinomortierella ambigua]|nr:PRP40 pre-mRNA processing factor 40 [Actinomortierella ambigua]
MTASTGTTDTGATAPPAAFNDEKALWTVYTHQDGREYYYHTVTKQTVWQKPDELKTPKELELEASPWKEYTTKEGKKYYHNAKTASTVWTIPDEYKALVEQLEQEKEEMKQQKEKERQKQRLETQHQKQQQHQQQQHQQPPPQHKPQPFQPQPSGPGVPPFAPPVAGGMPAPLGHPPHLGLPVRPAVPFVPQPQRPPIVPIPQRPSKQQSTANVVNQAPEFETKEEAEKAFMKMLKDTGVTSTWTWEQTMRAVVTDPMYRALKTIVERKAAFQTYVEEQRIAEQEEAKAKEQKLRADFLALLESSGKVTHATRYSTVKQLFAEEAAFTAFGDDDRLRQSVFNSMIDDLTRKEKELSRQRRREGMTKLTGLLKAMPEITYATRWAAAQEMYMAKPDFQRDEVLRSLNKVDQLSVFEEHIKVLERDYEHQRERKRLLRRRTERKRREGFKALLGDLRGEGKVNARTEWSQVYPSLKDDARYQDILGQPGSTPQELFWDLIEDLDEKLYQDRKVVQEVLKASDYEIFPETTFEEFYAQVQSDEKIQAIRKEDIQLIFDQLLAKAAHHAKEEKRRQERIARKKAEAFRYMLKHLDPPVTSESTWEEVKAKAESKPEFNAFDNDDQRKEVFERYLARLKERNDSDDEDGSILEDDADYYGGKRSSSGTDRKRAGHHSHYSPSSSSSTHHRHDDHHYSHSRDRSSKRSHDSDAHHSGHKHVRSENEAADKTQVVADDSRLAKKSKTEEEPLTPSVAPDSEKEEGEV